MDMIYYCNIIMLFIGIYVSYKVKRNMLFSFYFFSLVLAELIGKYLLGYNLYLMAIVYYTHFVCINYYLFHQILSWKKNRIKNAFIIFSLPLFVSLIAHYFNWEIKYYDRIIYNISIIFSVLYVVYKTLSSRKLLESGQLLLLFSILGYFAIDFVIALASNYLINGEFLKVAWIWIIRAIGLFTLYYALTKVVWKMK